MRAAWALLLALCAPAAAQVKQLRLATPAPEGTAWHREGVAFARDLLALTHGQLGIKFYLGGITGNEVETAERMRRGQIDMVASGGELCARMAPSTRVLRVVGLFQDGLESAYIAGRLRQTFDEEYRRSGVINLGSPGIGPEVIFSREPIRSMADLAKARLWVWDLDEVLTAELPQMGVGIVPLPLDEARRAYDEGRLGGFYAVPQAALAFQWSAQARYVSDLRAGYLRGCLLISSAAYDALGVEAQQALRAASAKLIARLEDLGRRQDEALLGRLFERQGVKTVPAPPELRREFFEAARNVRERLGAKLVPPALLQHVLALLADFRAEKR